MAYDSPLADALQADALERFVRYVRIDTQSDRHLISYPSTAKQLDLSRLLADELRGLGLEDVELTDHGYVFATLPGSNGPTVGLVAHVDTSPDAPGAGVEPRVHRAYDGGELVAGLSPETSTLLADRIGHDIVTSDGTTLLGADDKAGWRRSWRRSTYRIAPRAPARARADRLHAGRGDRGRHGPLRRRSFGADFAYTVDGATRRDQQRDLQRRAGGHLPRVGVHPGSAKGMMVNPIKLAARFLEPAAGHAARDDRRARGVRPSARHRGRGRERTVTVILRDFDSETLIAEKELEGDSPRWRWRTIHPRASNSSASSSTAT